MMKPIVAECDADKRMGNNIVARLENGVHAAMTLPANPELRVDDRIMMEGGVQNTEGFHR